jgi:predicted metal-dependent phosphoesterase TrpH
MIDLHIHTTHSDGRQTVRDVIEKARQNGVKTISITDHNSVGAYENFTAPPDLCVIRGIEIYYVDDVLSNEILGYGIDPEKIKPFLRRFAVKNLKIEIKNLKFIRKQFISLGFVVSSLWVLRKRIKTVNLRAGRIILTDVLNNRTNAEICEKYALSENTYLYDNYLKNPKSPFYVPNLIIAVTTLHAASEAIHASGGTVIMAHTFKKRDFSLKDAGQYLKSLLDRKLIDGVEVFHPAHNPEQTKFLLEFCKKHGCHATGGTDNHNFDEKIGIPEDEYVMKTVTHLKTQDRLCRVPCGTRL